MPPEKFWKIKCSENSLLVHFVCLLPFNIACLIGILDCSIRVFD